MQLGVGVASIEFRCQVKSGIIFTVIRCNPVEAGIVFILPYVKWSYVLFSLCSVARWSQVLFSLCSVGQVEPSIVFSVFRSQIE